MRVQCVINLILSPVSVIGTVMIITPFAALLAILPLSAFAGQIPVVDGVLGGVPSSKPNTKQALKPSTAAAAAGYLRVTENSGICGVLIKLHPFIQSKLYGAETTDGVYQASGYGDLDANSHMWYVLSLKFTFKLRTVSV